MRSRPQDTAGKCFSAAKGELLYPLKHEITRRIKEYGRFEIAELVNKYFFMWTKKHILMFPALTDRIKGQLTRRHFSTLFPSVYCDSYLRVSQEILCNRPCVCCVLICKWPSDL